MQFVCRYGLPDGRVLQDVQTGADASAVRRELERRGLHVFEVRPRGVRLDVGAALGRRRRKLPMQKFLAFNQEMAALLRAGLPLLQALDLMLERMEDPVLSDVLGAVRDDVRSGAELSEAFAKHGDLFPPIYAAMLKAGERSGELEAVLRRFLTYLKLLLDARSKVTSALVYPAALVVLSTVMLMVMAVYVVPAFSRFYADLDAELPQLTQITLAISFWLRDNFLWLAIGVIVGQWALGRWKRTPTGRRFFDRLILRVPIFGGIVHLFALSQFCRSSATLVAGGIPLVPAMETAMQAVTNTSISDRVLPALDEVRQGKPLNVSLEETNVFPALAIDMIKVGEATGALDEMLTSVADYFDEHIATRVERVLALVEPVMLVFMGCLIGVLLVSIYLPMFSAIGQVGR
ncbi:MAG: type II secretion system F family protein [Acidobacteriota bacterium]